MKKIILLVVWISVMMWLGYTVAGCTTVRPIVLHPIEKTDIFSIDVGTKIGNITTEKHGYFVSDLYIEEVMKAKIE